jgi:hypothetical protein
MSHFFLVPALRKVGGSDASARHSPAFFEGQGCLDLVTVSDLIGMERGAMGTGIRFPSGAILPAREYFANWGNSWKPQRRKTK